MEYNKIKKSIDNSNSMLKASEKLNIPFTSFIRMAKKYNLYTPNQGRKGIKRKFYEDEKHRIPLNKILEGNYPNYSRGY